MYAVNVTSLAFSIGTTELVVAGILPAIAADLGVTIPDAGLLVSGYAIGVAFGGPALMVLAGRYPRKPAIVWVLVKIPLDNAKRQAA